MKKVEEHVVNPSIKLLGYILKEKPQTIRSTDSRFGKVSGRIERIHTVERIKVFDDDGIFTKLYVKDGALKEYNKLSKGAQRVLEVILFNLSFQEDSFFYNPISLSKSAEIDERNISTYIHELIELNWIWKSTEKRRYWINLLYICNGSREEFYRKYKVTQT